MIGKLAEKKWFIPIILFIFIIIAISSLTEASNDEAQASVSVESQLEGMCNEIAGVRNAKVMITYENSEVSVFSNSKQEKILGIAVVCEGGDNPNIQLKIHKLIEALFNLSSTRITVSERNTKPLS